MQTTTQREFDGPEVLQPASPSATASKAPHQTPGLSAGSTAELLTDQQAAAWFGISVRKFHELRTEPWLPKPIVLGPRLLRWARSELSAALVAMPRHAQTEQPAQLLRARIERAKRTGVLS